MMKTQNKKRGFTIIELVIVVTVIAILSAVLIPVFAGVIKNANLSADKAAVRSLNTIVAESEEDFNDVEDVKDYLETKGYDLDSYVPASKDYTFVWSAEKNMIMIYSEDAKAIVFPDAYAGKSVAYVTLVTDKGETSNVVADKSAAEELSTKAGVFAIDTDIALDTALYTTKDLTINLAGEIKVANDTVGDGVFCVKKGTLTLNGDGIVNGKAADECDYNMAIWADGGEVVINGGTYTNVGAKATDATGAANNNELIYVKNGGKVIINGGTFIGANTTYVLNSHDSQVGSIIVKGGKFYNYDPATMANDATITVAEGYKVVAGEADENGNIWYEVVKA